MKESIKKELEPILPLLTSLKHEQGEKQEIPEGYFSTMQKQVLSKIIDDTDSNTDEQKNNLFTWRFLAGIAASLLIVTGVGLYFFSTTANEADNSLTQNQLQTYIESNIDDFDIELLEELVIEDNSIENLFSEELDDESIIEYLYEHLDETDDILFEDF